MHYVPNKRHKKTLHTTKSLCQCYASDINPKMTVYTHDQRLSSVNNSR